MARKRKNKRQKWKDFTLDEQFTIIAMIVTVFFVSLHYILAFIGRDPMIELAITWVGTFLLLLYKYSVKSFNAKKEEEKMKYRRDLNNVPDMEKIFEEDEEEESDLWNG